MSTISPIGQLAILLTRADEQDRTSARQTEDAAEQAAVTDENDRVEQLRAKADNDGNAALASGIADIAGGACLVGAAAFAPAAASSKAVSSDSTVAAHGLDWNATFNGVGRALPGVGEVIGSELRGAAERDDADAARLEAQAQADIRRFNRAQSDEQAIHESMQKVEQFVDQTQQAENAARLAAATFRG